MYSTTGAGAADTAGAGATYSSTGAGAAETAGAGATYSSTGAGAADTAGACRRTQSQVRARRTRGQSACRRARRTCRSCDGLRQPPPYAQLAARASRKHEVSCCVSAMRSNRQHGRRVQHQPWMSPAEVSAKRSENNACEPRRLVVVVAVAVVRTQCSRSVFVDTTARMHRIRVAEHLGVRLPASPPPPCPQ